MGEGGTRDERRRENKRTSRARSARGCEIRLSGGGAKIMLTDIYVMIVNLFAGILAARGRGGGDGCGNDDDNDDDDDDDDLDSS